MGIFGLFGKESYSVECARCHESLTITREEVEAGGYTCPVCNGTNPIPESVRAEYKKNRAEDELRRQKEERKQSERERKHREREKQRAQKEKERRQRVAVRQRARQEELERSREKEQARKVSLRAGQCPDCGAELQVLQKGYDTGTGVACCLFTGPIGLLAGLLGSGKKTRVCKGCGREFRF